MLRKFARLALITHEEQWFNFIEVNQTAKDVKELQKELHELKTK